MSLPIPIEEIAESALKLTIVPTVGIKKEFDIDGCINSDLTTIFVDYDLYMKRENRTRFTIAHEVGHLVIHSEIFKSFEIKTAEDLIRLQTKITDEESGWLEYQAYAFAGHCLVPRDQLVQAVKKIIGRVPQQEPLENLFPMTQDLLEIFNVSGDVMLKRLQKEGLVKTNGPK